MSSTEGVGLHFLIRILNQTSVTLQKYGKRKLDESTDPAGIVFHATNKLVKYFEVMDKKGALVEGPVSTKAVVLKVACQERARKGS